MKYPIGIQSFDQIIEDGYVYIDKTALVYDMVKNRKIYFLSRPRRFGKSLLVSTLECYFRGRKELFRGLAIDSMEKEWNVYPVFHIDFNGKNFTSRGELENALTGFVEAQEAVYGKDPYHDTLGDRFGYVLKAAHEKSGQRAVVLIDEYDKPLLDVLDTGLETCVDGQARRTEDWNREVLKGFYSVFKAALTIKKFNRLTNSYLLDFPNDEVRNGFVTLLASIYLRPKEEPGAWVIQVVAAMEEADMEQLRRLFASFLASIPYSQRRKEMSASASATSSTHSISSCA